MMQSVRLLSDAMRSFTDHCLAGIEPNEERIAQLLQRSLILVTGLVPLIGYDRACTIAKKAALEGITLRQAALASGVEAAAYDEVMDPKKLARM